MKKNDRLGLRGKVLKFWESRQADRNAGFGQLPEICPYNPVAYLLQCVSLYDAIGKWAAERVEPSYRLEFERIPLAARARRECAKAIRSALGPHRDNYDAAEKTMDDWCSKARAKAGLISGKEGLRLESFPVMIPVWEINRTIRPMLVAYRNPREFFSEVAPRFFPGDFNLRPDDWQRLAGTLRTWKYGALLNPNVRATFDAVAEDPRAFAEVLGQAERRKAYADGRKPGSKDTRPRKRRVDNVATKAEVWRRADEIEEETRQPRGAVSRAVREKAEEKGRKPSAIRRRMSRAGKPRSSM